MGNSFSPCCQPQVLRSSVKLIFWEGSTKILTGKSSIAGELMFQFPNMVVCHADSFYIGHPVPTLSIDDKLIYGETYFVLPIDLFACKVLTISSLSSLVSGSKPAGLINISATGQEGPFQYEKGANGKLLIKVSPEFITKLISRKIENTTTCTTVTADTFDCSNNVLISTPELKKQYDQLVGYFKEQVWSPKLETISERKMRSSPIRFLGLEKRDHEN
ncbi:hypothetical protein FRX31_018514 [Thalictrum thalictroides]|uniref:Uncharacterized protein n=1 Tax=Thalictrum thalictroides TaxID=46969 RepID=A0A7J6W494_THATH|nr:hypothetical protein FRX31_018514 [Thalictrum thalictroides]